MAATSSSPPWDDSVLRAAQAGAGWAFTHLWQALAPAVAGYARAQGCPEPDDVTSEVFLAAFTRMEVFEGDSGAFRSWLFAIAHHKVIDERRKRTRRGIPEQYDPQRDTRDVASAEHDALTRIGDERVLRALARLAPDQREVLVLRIVADLTIEQIASTLDKRVGAVKALQRRGLAALRRAHEISSLEAVPLSRGQAITEMR